ncbi:9440_t:CDS:10, partial [Entrophospora sp. SA101]
RKWNIAFYQKVVTEEYLGIILGKPLPPYQQYNENLVPGIDLFFATITFKYVHSELGNNYRIQDEFGELLADLTLDNILQIQLLEKFGMERVLRSMSLQHQEELDIYYSDAMRNATTIEPRIYDIAAFDVLRARDRGIALYNDARQAYGLTTKKTWQGITSVKILQDYLQQLYPNGPNQLETSVGAIVEDHLDGSNFGELMSISMFTQFTKIRDSDKFWWENGNMFTDVERVTLKSTTFKDIILRNLPENNKPIMPQNIWTVQPQSKTTNSSSAVDVNYPNDIPAWSPYVIKYRIDDSFIHFKVTLQTGDGEGWFGMGFEPDDIGMKGADFVIGFVRENKIDIFNYRSSSADHYPPDRDDNSDLTNINSNVSDSLATIEFSRPLLPDGRRGIKDGHVKCKKKYPFSSSFTYHGNNRILIMIDFYNNKIEAVKIKASQQTTKYIHGIGMSFTWSVLFPISIFIVRFFKHTNNYLKIHRTIQLLGGISIGSFGASVLAMSNSRTPHSFLGLTLYCIVFIQLAIGLISIWSQASLVSVNLGYPRLFKRTHKFLGISLLIVSWINIYLGMDTYSLSYGIECEEDNSGNQGTKKFIIEYLGDEKYNNILPELTLDEFNDKVQRGAHLVICDGFVVDIRKWIGVHPGGAKILESVIGTDITDAFHPHSLAATKKMTTMIIANLNENINDQYQNNYDTDDNVNGNWFVKESSRLKGQMVIRHYSPIDGKIMKSFSILVKIYPNGSMSKHLNDRLIGFEIQARGPFDIGDRILSTNPITTTTISPPLTLIKFHLKHYNFNNNNSKLSMHLIYANKSVDDSIVNLKDCYYHSLNNNNTNDNTNIDDVLSITYIFDKLPDNFSASITGEGEEELQRIRKSGLEGKIDKDILESWFKGGEETSSSTSSIPSPSPAAAVKASSS